MSRQWPACDRACFGSASRTFRRLRSMAVAAFRPMPFRLSATASHCDDNRTKEGPRTVMSVAEIDDGVYESTATIDNGTFGTRTIRFDIRRLVQPASGSAG